MVGFLLKILTGEVEIHPIKQNEIFFFQFLRSEFFKNSSVKQLNSPIVCIIGPFIVWKPRTSWFFQSPLYNGMPVSKKVSRFPRLISYLVSKVLNKRLFSWNWLIKHANLVNLMNLKGTAKTANLRNFQWKYVGQCC